MQSRKPEHTDYTFSPHIHKMDPQWPKRHYTLLEVVEELCKSDDDEQDHPSSDDEPDMLLPEEISDSALDR